MQQPLDSGTLPHARSTASDGEPGIPIFFKVCLPELRDGRSHAQVDERVKKARFLGTTLSELRALFLLKYADSGWSLDNAPTLHLTDQKTNVVFELDDIKVRARATTHFPAAHYELSISGMS